jgi:hypothetical protein
MCQDGIMPASQMYMTALIGFTYFVVVKLNVTCCCGQPHVDQVCCTVDNPCMAEQWLEVSTLVLVSWWFDPT